MISPQNSFVQCFSIYFPTMFGFVVHHAILTSFILFSSFSYKLSANHQATSVPIPELPASTLCPAVGKYAHSGKPQNAHVRTPGKSEYPSSSNLRSLCLSEDASLRLPPRLSVFVPHTFGSIIVTELWNFCGKQRDKKVYVVLMTGLQGWAHHFTHT